MLRIEPLDLSGLELRGNAITGAVFSPDLSYRYALWRQLSSGVGDFVVIGLNPSTADETANDPTIRRCLSFAHREGKARLVMLNLFGYRATSPLVMKAAADPIGKENDRCLSHYATERAIVVAAWGVHGQHRNRASEILQAIPGAMCFGKNRDGSPKHPLYLAASTRLDKMSV